MKKYDPLPIQTLTTAVDYIHSGELPEVAHMEDFAHAVMVDFKGSRALTINKDKSIDEAHNEMTVTGVHLLLVTDQEQKVIGVISSEDILGNKPVRISQERGISRKEILVGMMMTRQDKVIALEMEDLRIARVAHVVATLKSRRQHYALAIETHPETHESVITGLFSLAQISRQLGINVLDDELYAKTLSDLQRKID